MFVQRIETWGRRFTNFHYYYYLNKRYLFFLFLFASKLSPLDAAMSVDPVSTNEECHIKVGSCRTLSDTSASTIVSQGMKEFRTKAFRFK